MPPGTPGLHSMRRSAGMSPVVVLVQSASVASVQPCGQHASAAPHEAPAHASHAPQSAAQLSQVSPPLHRPSPQSTGQGSQPGPHSVHDAPVPLVPEDEAPLPAEPSPPSDPQASAST